MKNENFALRPATESELKISEKVKEFTYCEKRNLGKDGWQNICIIPVEKTPEDIKQALTDTQKDTAREIQALIHSITWYTTVAKDRNAILEAITSKYL